MCFKRALSKLVNVCNEPKQVDNQTVLQSSSVLVIVPHPDDEVLGFGGIIYEAVKSGKNVKVVIVTNGEGYDDAAYFWKNGFPKGDYNTGTEPTKDEIELFGHVRLRESTNALSVLGLQSNNIITLGYPDGKLREMHGNPLENIQGNTYRKLTNTNKSFNIINLIEDIKSLLRNAPDSTVLATHMLDHHGDHSALACIVQVACNELEEENLYYNRFCSILHDPDATHDSFYPEPGYNWKPKFGKVIQQRESRYKPNWEIKPPRCLKAKPCYFENDKILWSGEYPLLRKAIDCYQTQIGINQSNIMKGYEGWVDRNGFFNCFVRKNHLLWGQTTPAQRSEGRAWRQRESINISCS